MFGCNDGTTYLCNKINLYSYDRLRVHFKTSKKVMKKFIFGVITFVLVLIVIGTFWNLDLRKEHGYDKYQKELAKREQRIKELEDSISNMQETLDFYREAVMWLRKADDKELQKNIEFLRNIPTKMIP